jgi:hypothetical protein
MNGNPFGATRPALTVFAAGFYSTTPFFSGEVSEAEIDLQRQGGRVAALPAHPRYVSSMLMDYLRAAIVFAHYELLLFVTQAVVGRRELLARKEAVNAILEAGKATDHWLVGRFAIMSDHLHFFCAARVVELDWRRIRQELNDSGD